MMRLKDFKSVIVKVSVAQVWPTLWYPWTHGVICKTPLSMGLSSQKYWSGLPFPSPGDLPNQGIEPRSPMLPADSLPFEPPRKPMKIWCVLPHLVALILQINLGIKATKLGKAHQIFIICITMYFHLTAMKRLHLSYFWNCHSSLFFHLKMLMI